MKVYIDQDLCTGDGICSEICPELFAMHSDGLAYVKEADWADVTPAGPGVPVYKMAWGLAEVPDQLLDACIESAEDCPGECIYIVEDE